MKRPVYLLFLTLLTLSSCVGYLPQSVDVPLISKKNDLRIDAGVTSALSAGTATISYGLTERIAVQAYGNLGANSRNYYQGAIGYYKNLKNRSIMELYGGVGNGNANYKNHDLFSNTSGAYQLYFAQFNYGKLGGDLSIWDLGLGLKTGLLHTNLVREDMSVQLETISTELIGDNFLVEPMLFVRAGGEHVKFNLKLSGGYIFKYSNIAYFPLNIGLGLNYRL